MKTIQTSKNIVNPTDITDEEVIIINYAPTIYLFDTKNGVK